MSAPWDSDAGPVVTAYRLSNFRVHVEFNQYFGPDAGSAKPAQNPQCVADDLDANWKKAGYVGRL